MIDLAQHGTPKARHYALLTIRYSQEISWLIGYSGPREGSEINNERARAERTREKMKVMAGLADKYKV